MQTFTCHKCQRKLPLTRQYFRQTPQTKTKFQYQCRECEGFDFRPIAKDGYKICSKCHEELPATLVYFYGKHDGVYGLKEKCKKCCGKKEKPIVPDGFIRCSACQRTLPATTFYFNKNKTRKYGVDVVCRECLGYEFRERIEPKDGYKFCTKCGLELPRTKSYFHYNKHRGWFSSCMECTNKQHREYHHNNPIIVKAKSKKYYHDHKEEKAEYCKQYRLNNLEHSKEVKWAYYKNNKPKIRQRIQTRYREDIQFNIACKVRGRIREAFKSRNLTKSHKTIELLGCTFQFYQSYLTVCFTEGMTWDLYLSGDIVADHIKPIVLFDLTDEKQVLEGFNWMNTTPMWHNENEDKNSFYQGKFHRRPKPFHK